MPCAEIDIPQPDGPPSDTLLPLTDRTPGAILFRDASGAITAEQFIEHAIRTAAALPDAAYAVNCCTTRYAFAVGFAAALIRGQTSILTADQSPRNLAALGARYGRVASLAEGENAQGPLPHGRIAPRPTHGTACRPVPHIRAGHCAALVFTSGSLGEPVGYTKSFGELVARSRAAIAPFDFSLDAPACVIGTVPPHHMYGFETTILLPFHAGAASWCEPVFYPADLHMALAAQPGRCVLVTTPLQLRAMLAMAGSPKLPHTVISATGPLDANLAGRAEQLWGARVLEIFGATEVGSIASRRTTCGPLWSLYPGVRLHGDAEPVVTAPGAEPRHLSDVVELDADGQGFRLLGRTSEMIKLGGRRASLTGLSQLLTAIDGVTDGVFVAPDDMDARPTARLMALMVSETRSSAEVLEALRNRIDPIFLPRPLLRVPALPRNAMGKITRQALLAMLAQARL